MNQMDRYLYQSFEHIFNRHYNSLCNYANSFLNDGITSEDIVQEVFTRIWEKKKDLIPDEDGCRYYLFAAVRNNCLSHLKKSRKNNCVSLTDQDAPEMPAVLHLDNKKYQDILKRALATLPPRCKEMFLLSRIGRLSYQEIADQTGTSIKTVENQIGKSLRLLRAFGEKYKIDSAALILILFKVTNLWIGVFW